MLLRLKTPFRYAAAQNRDYALIPLGMSLKYEMHKHKYCTLMKTPSKAVNSNNPTLAYRVAFF